MTESLGVTRKKMFGDRAHRAIGRPLAVEELLRGGAMRHV